MGNDPFGQAGGNRVLTGAGPFFDGLAGHEVYMILIRAENGFLTDIIGHDPVAVFSGQLRFCVFDQVVRFGGEGNDQRRAIWFCTGKTRDDIRVFGQGKGRCGRPR